MHSLPFPELPEVPATQIAERELGLRYEDVTQDGRLRLEGVWPAVGRILWTELDVAHALMRLAGQGIGNVLARLVIDCEVARAFERDDSLGLVAAFVEDQAPRGEDWASWGKPRCLARMLLSR